VRDTAGRELGGDLGQERAQPASGAGHRRCDGSRADGGAEDLREGVGGAAPGQELSLEQVDHDRLGHRPVLHGCAGVVGGRGAGDVPAPAPAGEHLVFDDVDRDRGDVEDLGPGGAGLRCTAKVAPAPAAAGWFVHHDLVRDLDLTQGLTVVAGLPAGAAPGGSAQRLRCRLAQPVKGRRLGGVARVRAHLRFQLQDAGLEGGVLLAQRRRLFVQGCVLLAQRDHFVGQDLVLVFECSELLGENCELTGECRDHFRQLGVGRCAHKSILAATDS
jgi:hypothetical protein